MEQTLLKRKTLSIFSFIDCLHSNCVSEQGDIDQLPIKSRVVLMCLWRQSLHRLEFKDERTQMIQRSALLSFKIMTIKNCVCKGSAYRLCDSEHP